MPIALSEVCNVSDIYIETYLGSGEKANLQVNITFTINWQHVVYLCSCRVHGRIQPEPADGHIEGGVEDQGD